jgi:phosphoribosylformylglycinamidine cyclo-ligase
MKYKESGVDVSLAEQLIDDISGFSDQIGKYAATFQIPPWERNDLVASADGVGTKIILAKMAKELYGRPLNSVGQDCVAMVFNDMLCEGAKPLFFLDYYATNKLNQSDYREVLDGMYNACAEMDVKLIGGETAEMPGMFAGNAFDVCGFGVGIKRWRQHDTKEIRSGDKIIGLPSKGVHSNGFSVIRKILDEVEVDEEFMDMLLTPTPLYYKEIDMLYKAFVELKAISHITGGGLRNLFRVLPKDLCIKWNEFNSPYYAHEETFQWIQDYSEMSVEDMRDTFNCGLGMILVVNPRPNIPIPVESYIELGTVA